MSVNRCASYQSHLLSHKQSSPHLVRAHSFHTSVCHLLMLSCDRHSQYVGEIFSFMRESMSACTLPTQLRYVYLCDNTQFFTLYWVVVIQARIEFCHRSRCHSSVQREGVLYPRQILCVVHACCTLFKAGEVLKLAADQEASVQRLKKKTQAVQSSASGKLCSFRTRVSMRDNLYGCEQEAMLCLPYKLSHKDRAFPLTWFHC